MRKYINIHDVLAIFFIVLFACVTIASLASFAEGCKSHASAAGIKEAEFDWINMQCRGKDATNKEVNITFKKGAK